MGNDFSSVEALWSQFESVMAMGGREGRETREGGGDGTDKEGEGHE